MSEGPTATPEPVPWGDEADPFPVGTVVRTPFPREGPEVARRRKVGPCDHPRMVEVDGLPLLPEEIQGRIDEEGWKVVGRGGEQ